MKSVIGFGERWRADLLLYPKSSIELRSWSVSALPRMPESNDSQEQGQDAVGMVGLAFAVMGMWEMPLIVRLLCLLVAAICLPIAFISQPRWPGLVRWLLTFVTIAMLALMSLSAIKRG